MRRATISYVVRGQIDHRHPRSWLGMRRMRRRGRGSCFGHDGACISLSKPVTKMERRIINSINLEDGKIEIYMDMLKLEEERRGYCVGKILHCLYKNEVVSTSLATFFILNDFIQVRRILGDSRRMKCDNLLAPCAVGVLGTDQWVVAFRNSIDSSFMEWSDGIQWIEVAKANNIVRSLVQLMECFHGRGFRIGCSLVSPRCYGLMLGEIFLIDLEGSICSLPEGNGGEEEKQKDIKYLYEFLEENIVSKLEDRAGLMLRDFVKLMNWQSIKFSDLKGHPFCLEDFDARWFYNRMKLWIDRAPKHILVQFEIFVKKKKVPLRWQYFPDWRKYVHKFQLLNNIYQHNKKQYDCGGAQQLIKLGRNGMTHFREYKPAEDFLIVSKSINDMYPNFMAVCYTAMVLTGHRW